MFFDVAIFVSVGDAYGSPNQHIAVRATLGSGSRRGLHRVLLVVATLVTAGCGSTESTISSTAAEVVTTATAGPIYSAAYDLPCGCWMVVDGSTFESAAVGSPTLINPNTGNPSTPFYRNCGSYYEFDYLEPPLPDDASQASVIHPVTMSSTSSGPCTLTT